MKQLRFTFPVLIVVFVLGAFLGAVTEQLCRHSATTPESKVLLVYGTCVNCGSGVTNLHPLKIQMAGSQGDANGTTISRYALFKCPYCGNEFQLSLTPKHVPPPLLIGDSP